MRMWLVGASDASVDLRGGKTSSGGSEEGEGGGEEVDMMVYTARTKERAVKRTAQACSTPQKTPNPWSIDL